MENTRALFLIDHIPLKGEVSEFTEKDRQFLKTHIEMYEYLLQTYETENLILKDAVDRTKAMNYGCNEIRTKIIKIFENDPNIHEIFQYLKTIYKEIIPYEEDRKP